jgi:hypothetical protein
MFRNLVSFYGKKYLALHLTRKVEDHSSRLSATSYTVYCLLPFISEGVSAMRIIRTRSAAMKGAHLNGMKMCLNTYLLLGLNTPKTEYFVNK